MKSRRKVVLSQSRWLGYAVASAATAWAAAPTADADIHYSGVLNAKFDAPPEGSTIHSFPLAKRGNELAFEHLRRTPGYPSYGSALLSVQGRVSGGFAGIANFVSGTSYAYVSKLAAGQLVSTKNFITTASLPGYLAAGDGFPNSQWLSRGTGFMAFKFNNGAGPQYGWARIKASGAPTNAFIVIDYAYGDVGDSIRTGQRSSGKSESSAVPASGSLGLLATGGVGLQRWRQQRAGAVSQPLLSFPLAQAFSR